MDPVDIQYVISNYTETTSFTTLKQLDTAFFSLLPRKMW